MTHILLFTLPSFFTKELLITIIIGFVAGILAQFITPGRGYGLITSVIIGVIGSWIGQRYFNFIDKVTDIPLLNIFLRALLGAVILVIILNLILGKDKKDKTKWKSA